MASGPGQHDDLLTAALDAAARRAGDERWAHESGGVTELEEGARIHGGILIIFGEPPHAGFCCQASATMTARMPAVLRGVAHDIEIDMRAAGHAPGPHGTLGDDLPREMARVRDEVMPNYLKIGDAGVPALVMMRYALDQAARAAVEADLVGMLVAYKALQGFTS